MEIGKSFFLYFLLCEQYVSITYSASFFGASYIALPLQEAQKNSEISFRLKTYRSDALILLAAGQTDYCLILLEGGALRVRINLGAGESELSSPPRLRLDDLLWHEILLERKTSDVTLTIDGIHVTKQTLAGRFHELNIHQGLYIGGLGDFTDLFLGLLENFRGCIEQVVYNGLDVFVEARKESNAANVYAVDWECADEFDAPSDVPLSFVDQGAYVAFDHRFDRTGGSVEMQIKTQSENALIMYHSGPPSKSDFVALEIVSGKLRFILDTGNGAVDLNSSLVVSEGGWHRVEARFSPSHMEISLDDQIESRATMESENKFFDLSGYLFVGGVEVNKRARAVHQGTLNGGKSLAGCIKDLRVNEKQLGIRDPRVTMGIKADCKWAYPCVKSPCVESAVCIQEGTDGFRCECDLPLCVRQDFSTGYSVFTKTSLPLDMEILSLSPLEVPEGGQGRITRKHLGLVLDHEKYGIRDSGVVFHIFEPPKKGTLRVSLWGNADKSAFTYLDVSSDRVTYTHDGSESKEDSVVFEMELITQPGYILPSYLQTRHRFVLPIIVMPTNDPPSVSLPPGQVLKLPIGTKIFLTQTILNATDPDSSSKLLRYSILNLKDGFMESLHNPGVQAEHFTQEDINLGLISYKHSGKPEAQIILKVSDGESESPTVVLKVAAFDLEVYLVNNTGLHMSHNSWAFISSSNLSCSTNAMNQNVEVRYQITDPFRYGSIQRLRTNNKWQPVNSFTNRQIEKWKIRYEHTSNKPEIDEFRFRMVAEEKEFNKEFTFRVSFVSVSLEIVNNVELLIDRIQESFISEGFLRTLTKPSQTSPENIVYTIISAPHYGSIFKSSGDLSMHNRLRASSNFSQEDIAKGRIKYKLHHKTYSQFHDTLEFVVSSEGQSSDIHIFNIRYKPPPLDALVRVKDMDVDEGGKVRITEKYLKIEKKGLQKLIYNVTSGPFHGILTRNKGMSHSSSGAAATQFTSDDVYSGSISYNHDGSESIEDNVYFVAYGDDPLMDFQYIGLLTFNIVLKNDNPPFRVFEKVLNVVTNGERIITSKDLMYVDPDLNTQPYQILYTRKKISNGEFFHINERSQPIYSFTQEDINKKNVIFQHSGPIYSKAHITVSDGKLSVSGTLEIVASDPFIEVFNNSGIIVPRSGGTIITNHNLSVETNLNAWGNSVLYRIIQEPQHGYLKVQGKPGIPHFTELDLVSLQVEYHHNGNAETLDEFQFKASIGEISTDGVFEIQIFPESYWEPLHVVANITAELEENSEYVFEPSIFNIMHPNIAPEDIIYYVIKKPKHGYIKLQQQGEKSTDDEESSYNLMTQIEYDDYGVSGLEESPSKHKEVMFTQAMINEGKVSYVHTSLNSSTDFFVFDITNGITGVQGLYSYFQIIPRTVYVTAGTIKVEEGSKVVLTSSLITILSPYHRDRLNTLLISDQPANGTIQRASRPGQQVIGFTPLELEKGLIEYIHDGSETVKDSFSLLAVSDNRRSSPVRVSVIVVPVNDERPQVLKNEQILLWEGETVKVTNEFIDVFDKDTLAKDIVFKVWSPDCGFVSMSPNITHPVTKFTQDDIDNGKLFFTHTGPLRGKIQWIATDGKNDTEIQFTHVQAKPLHLRIIKNKPLYIFPMTRTKIAPQNLLISTNAAALHRSISYNVRKGPTLGRLLLEDINGVLRPTNNFTQRNINDSKVMYEQIKPIHELSTGDYFVFEVVTPFAEPLVGQTFDIHITVSGEEGGELGKYLLLQPVRVTEGASVILLSKNINITAVTDFLLKYSGTRRSTYLFAKIMNPPEHGVLSLNGQKLKKSDQFRANDVESGSVVYQHDGGDSLRDKIDISIYLVNSAHPAPDVLLFNGSLNITISPVNDQPFKLMTQIPGMVVVRGQKAFILQKNLLTEDADNSPNEILYEVMSGPDHGQLVNAHNQSMRLHSFTQEDINSLRVLYLHDGSNSSAKFYFQVSDGAHEPRYTVFTINLEHLHITLVNHTTVPLRQASTVAYIKSQNLAAITNGNSEVIVYNVTRIPRHGRIFVENTHVSNFSQKNVNNANVIYIQEDLSATGDSFSVDTWIYDQVIKDVEIRVVVRPLLESKPLSAVVGGRTRLTLEHLNASKLASVTDSMPLFRIFRVPRLGRIKKVSKRPKRSGRAYQVNEFTHEDVRNGKIYYVSRKLRLRPGEPLHDSLHYILMAPAPDVQPAQGTLTITLVTTLMEDAAEGRHLRPDLPPEVRSPAAPSRPHPEVKNPSYKRDYMMLAALAAGILLVLVLAIAIVRCTFQRKLTKNGKGSRGGVISGSRLDIDVASLPPPACTDSRPNSFMTDDFSEIDGPRLSPLGPSPRPQHLLPHTASNGLTLSAHLSDSEASWPREISREVSPSVPQCKVTPLCPEMTYNSPCQSPCQPPSSIAGYPYGADVDQMEEWSMYETQPLRTTNPMLRKNQYWV